MSEGPSVALGFQPGTHEQTHHIELKGIGIFSPTKKPKLTYGDFSVGNMVLQAKSFTDSTAFSMVVTILFTPSIRNKFLLEHAFKDKVV